MEKLWQGIRRGINAVLIVMTLVLTVALAARVCGIQCFVVMSGSMEPALVTGSVCIVDTNASYEEVKEGDIIVFRRYQTMVTHRVIAVTQAGLETKGDANAVSDGICVTQEEFYGKTLGAIPYAGYVLYAFRKPETLWITGILFVLAASWEWLKEEELLW